LILRKQKRTTVGRGTSGVRYEAIPASLQKALAGYVKKGGRLLVSGSFAISDLFDSRSNEQSKEFAENILGVRLDEEASRTRSGKIELAASHGRKTMAYSNTVNSDHYIVEKPDALMPATDQGKVLATFTDSNAAAGVKTQVGKGVVTYYSIPVETLKNADDRKTVLSTLFAQ
ncbi:MAG: hypothetical protein K2M31_08795, partial [Muribaculaceae bacterium]|nr:hypothetical protein [Muribaculaceae bacterium]